MEILIRDRHLPVTFCSENLFMTRNARGFAQDSSDLHGISIAAVLLFLAFRNGSKFKSKSF